LGLTLVASSPAGAGPEAGPWLRGPLRIRTQFPLSLFFLGHTPEEAAVLPPGRTAVSWQAVHSSIWARSENIFPEKEPPEERPDLVDAEALLARAQEHPEEVFFLLDGEITRSTLTVEHGLTPRWQVGLEVPLLTRGGGTMDHFINAFHQALGFPPYGRDRVPEGVFQFIFLHGPHRWIDQQQETTSGLGDVTLRAKVRLAEEENRRPAVAASLALKLPTGTGSQRSSGHTEAGLAAHATRRFRRSSFTVSGGYYWLGSLNRLPGLPIADVQSVTLAWERHWSTRRSVVLQYAFNTSPLRRAGAGDLSDPSHEILLGYRHRLWPNGSLECSLTENLIEFNNSPDLGLQVGGQYVF